MTTVGSSMHPGGGSHLFKRHNSADGGGGGGDDIDLDSLASLDPTSERPKSQAKLDPLQIHKLNREVRPGRAQVHLAGSGAASSYSSNNSLTMISSNGGTVLSGRTTALSKLQTRSQMMRPRSSVQQQPQQQ